ncbi:unnamed protein product [Strongylus vulgaris]|uniref:Uncharacterized protein n=1 Tax=Strongylus vulgaris TaxID=40348 RepID=A0A3P7LJD4_STRVU|nr:unnamed protein product [Strongylus vulgaris]
MGDMSEHEEWMEECSGRRVGRSPAAGAAGPSIQMWNRIISHSNISVQKMAVLQKRKNPFSSLSALSNERCMKMAKMIATIQFMSIHSYVTVALAELAVSHQ